MKNTNPCPLCRSKQTAFYAHTLDKDYFLCKKCELIYVSDTYLLENVEEKKRYDFHNNDINDPKYVQFLSQLKEPLTIRLKPKSLGLDFGSGPEPVLAQLFIQEGFKIDIFDPFYAKNDFVFTKKYDFITLTEVAEHLYNPAFEIEKIVSLLKANAFLAIMTLRTDNIKEFNNWFYLKDDTHVRFFSNKSMEYIAKKYNLSLEIINERVVIFRVRS